MTPYAAFDVGQKLEGEVRQAKWGDPAESIHSRQLADSSKFLQSCSRNNVDPHSNRNRARPHQRTTIVPIILERHNSLGCEKLSHNTRQRFTLERLTQPPPSSRDIRLAQNVGIGRSRRPAASKYWYCAANKPIATMDLDLQSLQGLRSVVAGRRLVLRAAC